MIQAQTEQHIPESKPNQQHQSVGLIYVDYQLPRVLTLDELDKAINYLKQIQEYAKNNNCQVLGFNDTRK
jgi:hypothetical protein